MNLFENPRMLHLAPLSSPPSSSVAPRCHNNFAAVLALVPALFHFLLVAIARLPGIVCPRGQFVPPTETRVDKRVGVLAPTSGAL
jgi:hypothetical protein